MLIENVISLWASSRSCNATFPGTWWFLAFLATNLGHQENCQNEILNSLKYVCPWGGFQTTFTLAHKCEVNGQNKHPVFTYLKNKFPYPYDDPFSLITNPSSFRVQCATQIWPGILRSSLPGRRGKSFWHYNCTFAFLNIKPDIKHLLKVATRHWLLSTQIYSIQPQYLSLGFRVSLGDPAGPKLSLEINLHHRRVLPFLSAYCFFSPNFLVGDSTWPSRLGWALGLHRTMATS